MAAKRKRETRLTRGRLALYHALLLGAVFIGWHLMTNPLLVSEEFARNSAFFFGKPLVVLDGERMAGMLTFREVLIGLNANGGNLGDLRVKSLMVAEPVCGSPDDSIDRLRAVMTKNHVRYLPVSDAEKLLGVISFHDVAKSVIKETSFENRLLKRYIKNWPETGEPAQ